MRDDAKQLKRKTDRAARETPYENETPKKQKQGAKKPRMRDPEVLPVRIEKQKLPALSSQSGSPCASGK